MFYKQREVTNLFYFVTLLGSFFPVKIVFEADFNKFIEIHLLFSNIL